MIGAVVGIVGLAVCITAAVASIVSIIDSRK
jgi:hypothetical protein